MNDIIPGGNGGGSDAGDAGTLALSQRISIAKTDRRELDSLLCEYMPFIGKCVRSVIFRPESMEDNMTEAMLAFTQAVIAYESGRGSFVAYAKTIIRNRLIDSARRDFSMCKLERHDDFPDDEDAVSAWEEDMAVEVFERRQEEERLSLEVEALTAELSEWGFGWEDLKRACPKQDRSRIACQKIAETIISSPNLHRKMLEKRKLPSAVLSGLFPKKTLEKYRLYIIVIVLIEGGEYPHVRSFVPYRPALADKRNEDAIGIGDDSEHM